MSKTPKNKKFLELQGTRVYHNKKDNTIQLITTDPDLAGKPFQITLSQGTPTDQTLRELLIEKGVLTEEAAHPQASIPYSATHPSVSYKANSLTFDSPTAPWNIIPIGLGEHETPITIDLNKKPHTVITGGAGSGKSILQNNFIFHALQHKEKWKICAISPKTYDLAYLQQHPENLYALGLTVEDSFKAIKKLSTELDARYRQMGTENVSNFTNLQTPTPAILFILDNANFLLNDYYGNNIGTDTVKQALQALQALQRIALLGRAAGIFMVLSSQRPETSLLTPELKTNIDNRIAVGKQNRISSTLTIGTEEAAQTPSNICGRAIINVNKETTPFQIYFA